MLTNELQYLLYMNPHYDINSRRYFSFAPDTRPCIRKTGHLLIFFRVAEVIRSLRSPIVLHTNFSNPKSTAVWIDRSCTSFNLIFQQQWRQQLQRQQQLFLVASYQLFYLLPLRAQNLRKTVESSSSSRFCFTYTHYDLIFIYEIK